MSTVFYSKWRSIRVLLIFLLVAGGLAVGTRAFANHGDSSLDDSDFEIDNNANLKVDHTGPPPMLDWATVTEVRKSDLATGSDDDSYSGGAKEDDACPGVGTGSIPNNKSDLLTFGAYTEDAGAKDFLHLFWARVQEPSGTTLMDFELNQSTTTCSNGVNKLRTQGDLLIEYRIEQGGASAQIFAREWTGSAWGTATDLTSAGNARGTINTTAIPAAESDGLVSTGSVSARTFGEASIDLSFLFSPGDPCTAFGSVFLKSRSSTSFTSQLKDFIRPEPVNVSNCGSIRIIKQTDPDGTTDSFGFTTTGGLTPATFNLSDNGERLFSNVLAGTYTVSENVPTSGSFVNVECTGNGVTLDQQNRKVTINLAAGDNVVCTFNNRLKGSVLIHKVNGAGQLLAGATFTLTGPNTNLTMASTSAGVFCTQDLPFGTYTVTETQAPPGYIGAPAQTVTVNTTATCAAKSGPDRVFTNTPAPGRINISKSNDASPTAAPLNGAVFTLYSSNGDAVLDQNDATVGTCTTGVSNYNGAGTPAAGTCSFIDVPVGNYWVDETTVPAGHAKAAGLPTQVSIAIGTSPGVGQTINLPAQGSFVNPRTHKVIVIVCHEGTNTLVSSAVSDEASFNTIGAAPSFATEAQLCSLTGVTGKSHETVNLDVTIAGH